MRIVKFKALHRKEFLSFLAESHADFGKAWAARMKEIFSAAYSEPHLKTFSVLEAGKPVAFFATRKEVEAFVLYFILISKPHQGKGIGTAIAKQAEKDAKKAGAAFVRLDAYSNKRAISFYRKLGYKVGGRVRFYEEENDDQTFLYKKI